jgi:hypothetical protein
MIHFVTDDADKNKEIITSALQQAGVEITSYHRIHPALEDIFVSLVEESRRDEILLERLKEKHL